MKTFICCFGFTAFTGIAGFASASPVDALICGLLGALMFMKLTD